MSQTLKRLLSGVLTNRPVQFRSCDETAQDLVTRILPKVPLALSQRQQQAIRNAWSSDLSYVQGPPGTGKSHTIAALMLSALILDKRVLLVSHKKAAIDVVRTKLADILGDELAIYVGADTAKRAATRSRIQELISDVQSHGFRGRLNNVKEQEGAANAALIETLRQEDQVRRALMGALKRTNAVYQANEDHLRARKFYAASFGADDFGPEALRIAPPVSPQWSKALDFLADLQARRAAGDGATNGEFLKARMLLSGYAHKFGASWIGETPWDVHRLHAHHRAIVSFDRARMEKRNIQVDLNSLRLSLNDLRQRSEQQAKTYLRTCFRRIQMENAANAIQDLRNFAALFRLRAPRLVKPLMARIDYGRITKVFPLWLGEMRDLGAVLPLQSGIFDLAVVDEASQVNIAEIVPTFYRALSFVVVGDRKQLGLEAAGLFTLNRTFEELTWNNCFGGMGGIITYQEAKRREIAVSTSSILDFIVSDTNGLAIPKTTLDEHFRSMPLLAAFTSAHFYQDEGGLKIMTEVGANLGKDCFRLVEVGGARATDGKYVPREVDKAIELVKAIASGREMGNGSALRALGFRDPDRYPSVGVISFTTMQRDVLRLRAEDEIEDHHRNHVNLLIGTPEEFQGNERDVMILTFALGEGQRYAVSHYERPNRFNVATSRARKFTYAVLGRCPPNARLLRRYLAFFGYRPSIQTEVTGDQYEDVEQATHRGALWRLDARLCESEFELLLLGCLQEFVDCHSASRLKIYNQVSTCGQKRIDFVLYDEHSARSVAIEVDGPDHFCPDGRTYNEEHMARVAILQRAGWRIVHVPYFEWYRNGWLYDRDDLEFDQHLARFYGALRLALGIQAERYKRRAASLP